MCRVSIDGGLKEKRRGRGSRVGASERYLSTSATEKRKTRVLGKYLESHLKQTVITENVVVRVEDCLIDGVCGSGTEGGRERVPVDGSVD